MNPAKSRMRFTNAPGTVRSIPRIPRHCRVLCSGIHATSRLLPVNCIPALDYAYSDQFRNDWQGTIHIEVMAQLFRKLAFVYHPTITSLALRHAVCVYIGAFAGRPIMTRNDQLLHLNIAYRELRGMLNDPENLSEEVIFVCGLLAMSCSVEKSGASKQFVIHRNGMVSVMSHLFRKAERRLDSYQLSLFWPLLRNELFYHGDLLHSENPFSRDKVDDFGNFFQSCRSVLGVETRSQCRKYGRELNFTDGIIDRHECLTSFSNFVFLTEGLDKLSDKESTKSFERQLQRSMLLDILTDVQSIRDYEAMSEMDAIDLTGKFLFPGAFDGQIWEFISFSEVCHAFSKVNALLVSLSALGFARAAVIPALCTASI